MKIVMVKDLISELNKFPQDMPVSIDYAGVEIEEIKVETWVHSNYPYNLPDKDYVVIK